MNDYEDLIDRLKRFAERTGWSQSAVRSDVTEAIDAIQTLRVAYRMQKVEIDRLNRLNYVLEGVSPMPLRYSLGPRHTLYLATDGYASLEDTNNSDIMSLDECNIDLLAQLLQLHAKEHGSGEEG